MRDFSFLFRVHYDEDDTFKERDSLRVFFGSRTRVRASPARLEDAGRASGPQGPLTKLDTEGHFLARKRTSASRVTGEDKKLVSQCSHVLVRSVPSHVACFAANRRRALRAFRTSLRR